MKRSAAPRTVRSRPSAVAAHSSARVVVVPMATMRRPAARARLTAAAVSSGDLDVLRSDPVLLHVLGPEGAKRADAHVQGEEVDLGADRADAPEEIRGEVQPSGGRGDRPVVPRVHRLVPLAIVGLGRVVSGDVRGQGRQTVMVEQLEHGPGRLDRRPRARRLPSPRRCARAPPLPPRSPARPRGTGGPDGPAHPTARRRSAAASEAPPDVRRARGCRGAAPGITRLWLATTQSPSRKNAGRSLKRRSTHVPRARSTTRSREESRGSAGSCAISSEGNS